MKVVVTSPRWDLSGVNTVSATLVKGLRELGADAEVVLTDPCVPSGNPMPPVPGIVPIPLPGARAYDIRHNWRCLVRYLEGCAPCVYVPNYDMAHSCVCSRLSGEVVTVGVVHCDDAVHYDHVERLGTYWNAIVTVSEAIAANVRSRWPQLAERTIVIRNGVEIPPSEARNNSGTLRILYAGRVIQHQKRVLDLPRIMAGLRSAGVRVELTVAGSGPDDAALAKAGADLISAGAVRLAGTMAHHELMDLMQSQDVIILTSAFEGLPIVLMEAMVRGCVPIVTKTHSGIPEVVRDGSNGFCVPVGDIDGFVRCLEALAGDPGAQDRLRQAARKTIVDSFGAAPMARAYHDLFRRVLAERATFDRPRGPVVPPEWVRPLLDQQRWPNRVRVAVRSLLR